MFEKHEQFVKNHVRQNENPLYFRIFLLMLKNIENKGKMHTTN